MNKIRRSKGNRIFSGICGGIGEYFNIDPTIVRIICLLLGLSSFGTTVLVYLICCFVIPEDDGIIYSDDYNERNEKLRSNTPILIGCALILWGSFMLTKIFFPWFTIRLASLVKFWPILIIVLGVYIIINQRNK
ncbi:PspC domain-containing protein [Tissierella praeacuta]|uniref:PspC domain-containing protein n=1 Tax=Tissierella praeacuta TaxID=43131 RepID=UPI0033417BB1